MGINAKIRFIFLKKLNSMSNNIFSQNKNFPRTNISRGNILNSQIRIKTASVISEQNAFSLNRNQNLNTRQIHTSQNTIRKTVENFYESPKNDFFSKQE